MIIRTSLLSAGLLAALTFATADNAFARKGADDPAGHVRQGRGADDPVGDVRQGGGADDPADHDVVDDNGGDRPDTGAGGADDPADHDAADDNGGLTGGNGADDGPDHERAGDRQRGRGKG